MTAAILNKRPPLSTDQKSVVVSPFIVWIDSREQLPYTFEGLKADAEDNYRPLRVKSEVHGLDAGDYSLAGCESEVAIERKSLSDLYGTLGQGRQRFERELAKLNEMDFAAVVVEASWHDIAYNPPIESQMLPKSVIRSIFAFMVRHPRVHWLMLGNRKMAEAATYRLLERFWRDKVAKVAEDDAV